MRPKIQYSTCGSCEHQRRQHMSSSMRNPERAHDPAFRARHAHEHDMRTKPWRTAHSCKGHARTGRGQLWSQVCPDRARAGQAGRRSAQICARDWRRPAGGGGSGSILRTRDWIRGRAVLESKKGFEKASREALSPPTSSCEGGAHLAPGTTSPRCSRSTRPRFAARITALRARDGESERFGQRSTWRSGRVSEGRSPANKGHATR